jgi:hypothetical protein
VAGLYTIAIWGVCALEKWPNAADAQERMRRLALLPQYRDAVLIHQAPDGTVLGMGPARRFVMPWVLADVRRNNERRHGEAGAVPRPSSKREANRKQNASKPNAVVQS